MRHWLPRRHVAYHIWIRKLLGRWRLVLGRVPIRIIRRITRFLIRLVCNCCAHGGWVGCLHTNLILAVRLIITVQLLCCIVDEALRL